MFEDEYSVMSYLYLSLILLLYQSDFSWCIINAFDYFVGVILVTDVNFELTVSLIHRVYYTFHFSFAICKQYSKSYELIQKISKKCDKAWNMQ